MWTHSFPKSDCFCGVRGGAKEAKLLDVYIDGFNERPARRVVIVRPIDLPNVTMKRNRKPFKIFFVTVTNAIRCNDN